MSSNILVPSERCDNVKKVVLILLVQIVIIFTITFREHIGLFLEVTTIPLDGAARVFVDWLYPSIVDYAFSYRVS